ncbi:MAG: right-handed parallel beta-helix repeat-containing protein [Candidatus Eiseniibacteriota bacterium]|jgi:hypothetical protein
MRIARLVLPLTVSLLLLASITWAVDINVPGDYATIGAAIDAAVAGDQIFVEPGIYVENITLKDGVDVTSTMGPEVTTIDGGGVDHVVDAISVTLTLDGFTVTGGNATGNGGGIRVQTGANITVRNCILVSNLSAGEGGGIAIQDSQALVELCDIAENTARSGAGIYVDGASPGNSVSIVQCTVHDNATAGPAGDGAGIFVDSSSGVMIEETAIRNNSCGGLGGGIYVNSSTPTITDCLVDGNTADEGGGLSFHNQSGGMMETCTVFRNTSTNALGDKGGAISCTNESAPTVQRSILAGSIGGGAMNCGVNSSPLLTCNVLWANTGGDAICGTNLGDNQVADPQWCLVDPAASGVFTVQSDSPCAAAQSMCGEQIGVGGVGCGVDAVDEATWGRIKSTYRAGGK